MISGASAGAARLHRVQSIRDVSPSAYVLRLSREGLVFRPGQWINLGVPGSRERREYTIYSASEEDCIEVLIKEIAEGTVSRELRRCRPGDSLEVKGPHGAFLIDERAQARGRFLFIATGAGVSPFHCFTRSYRGLDYLLLHGVRAAGELYDRESFDPERFIPCISQGGEMENGIGRVYHGRLTSYLRENPVEPSRFCSLCGNSDMIYEAYAILRGYGVRPSRILAEVYF